MILPAVCGQCRETHLTATSPCSSTTREPQAGTFLGRGKDFSCLSSFPDYHTTCGITSPARSTTTDVSYLNIFSPDLVPVMQGERETVTRDLYRFKNRKRRYHPCPSYTAIDLLIIVVPEGRKLIGHCPSRSLVFTLNFCCNPKSFTFITAHLFRM